MKTENKFFFLLTQELKNGEDHSSSLHITTKYEFMNGNYSSHIISSHIVLVYLSLCQFFIKKVLLTCPHPTSSYEILKLLQHISIITTNFDLSS